MEIDRDRKRKLIELFPEAHAEGRLDIFHVCKLIGMDGSIRAQGGAFDRETLHTIRNAIGVVQSGARVLQRRFPDDNEAAQVLESIMNASQTLKQQVEKVTNG